MLLSEHIFLSSIADFARSTSSKEAEHGIGGAELWDPDSRKV
jgi:hypothetical protein